MPYKIRGNCVVKSDTGAVVKCHETHDEAVAHMRALYANVPDATKEVGTVAGDNYAHGPNGLMSAPGEGKTETIEPTESKKKKRKRLDVAEMFNAMLSPKEFASSLKLAEKDFEYAAEEAWHVQALLQAMSILAGLMHDEAMGGEVANVKTLNAIMDKLIAYMNEQKDELVGAASETDKETTPRWNEHAVNAQSSFSIEKDAQNHLRWILFSGSAYQDRDGEIIAEKAFERDCDTMEVAGDYGELLWWHCDGELHANEKEARPYLPLGRCDISLVSNKINIESGTFYDDTVGQALLEKAERLGASKSFYHAEDEPIDGVFYHIRTKERSLMPRARESNLLTRLFHASKEKEMATNDERVAALKKEIGKDKTDELLEIAKEMSNRADQVLASKEVKKKKKPADEESGEADDAGDEGDEKKTAMKEFNASLVAVKEQNAKFEATLKEQSEKTAQTEKALADMADQFAKMNRLVAALYGIQPKGNGFNASTAKETEVDPAALDEEVAKLAGKSARAAGEKSAQSEADIFQSLAGFVITGNRDN